ncbi:conserved hypothetical protein (plasmid) [Methylobacterium nodulans ORS 2060]|uniref:Uncharacterized protein n=1 Tax=Methylobacterium nodulans (strain LMG 21967 / CNCM I-2342 / ORS 2060) TaxID=460265 RepID=B8IXU5_METNO|nr:conserved hypothetical protein [Methylobacterium nodulans ORS 2060]
MTHIVSRKRSKSPNNQRHERDPLDAPAVVVVGAVLLFFGVLLNVVEML